MEVLTAVLVMVALGAVVWFVGAPLRAGRAMVDARERDVEARRDALDAAKQAKYQEIRDTELDRRTGKLTEEEWRSIDRQLRAEAVEILRQLDELGEAPAR
jgi:2,3-bisphosphoglycerate-independent phosphoglycerate mutase